MQFILSENGVCNAFSCERVTTEPHIAKAVITKWKAWNRHVQQETHNYINHVSGLDVIILNPK